MGDCCVTMCHLLLFTVFFSVPSNDHHSTVGHWRPEEVKLACEQAFGQPGNLTIFFPKQRACSQAKVK